MILYNCGEELKVCHCVRVDGFDYVLFVSSAAMKCFGCGGEGYIIRMCPLRVTDSTAEESGHGGGAMFEARATAYGEALHCARRCRQMVPAFPWVPVVQGRSEIARSGQVKLAW